MGLSKAGVADKDDRLTPLDILAAGQIEQTCFVEGWQGTEVKISHLFLNGKAGRFDAARNAIVFPALHFLLGQGQQVTRIGQVFLGCIAGKGPIAFQEGREPQLAQVGFE